MLFLFARKHITRLAAGVVLTPVLILAACSAPVPMTLAPTPVPTAAALEDRLNESFFLTMDMARHSLPSYHVAITGTRPYWNTEIKAVESETINLQADIAGSNLYLIKNLQQGSRTQVQEGYVIGGGLKAGPAVQEFEKQAGTLSPSTAISAMWEALPREVGLPLFIAAAGATLKGQETLDGRAVDRYELNSANSPSGTTRELGRTISIRQATGTAWLDRQSAALLKMVLDYEQNILDPATSRDVLGRGVGHLELRVTRIGNVQVALP